MISTESKYYFKAFGLTIQSPILLRGLIPIDSIEEPDINIVFQKIENYPELKLTKVQRKGLIATFGMHSEVNKDTYLVWENLINFRLVDGKLMVVDTKETDLDFLSLFIVSEALGILLFQRGDILLHASAIKLPNGSGIVFMGEPGAGKSTTAAAFVKAGCKIISDDLVAIRIIDQKPYLVPAFPQIKLWKRSVEGLGFEYNEVERIVEGTNKFAYYNEQDFDLEPALLVKIYILGAENEGLLSPIQTPIELLKYFALPEQLLEKGQPLKRHFEKSSAISTQIEIISKYKMKGFDQLEAFVEGHFSIA
ncbi:MAG: serine kinase [Bacteroidota bacterium]